MGSGKHSMCEAGLSVFIKGNFVGYATPQTLDVHSRIVWTPEGSLVWLLGSTEAYRQELPRASSNWAGYSGCRTVPGNSEVWVVYARTEAAASVGLSLGRFRYGDEQDMWMFWHPEFPSTAKFPFFSDLDLFRTGPGIYRGNVYIPWVYAEDNVLHAGLFRFNPNGQNTTGWELIFTFPMVAVTFSNSPFPPVFAGIHIIDDSAWVYGTFVFQTGTFRL